MAKKEKEKPSKPKSRAKYKCPPELDELIKAVNLLPIDFHLMSIQKVFNERYEKIGEISRKKGGYISPPISEILELCLKDAPEKFKDYIKNAAYARCSPFGHITSEQDFNFVNALAVEYSDYLPMREAMIWLVKRLENERSLMRDQEKQRGLKKNSITFDHFDYLNWDAFPLSIKTVIKRDLNGKLCPTGLVALLGKFDDSRLRRCEICEHIYWMSRTDQKTCSSKCASTLRVRRYRTLTEEEKAERKAKRKANTAIKRNQKERRKNVNLQKTGQ